LESAITDYYLPIQIEENIKDRLEMIDGKYDVVKSLYDDSFTQYDVGGQNTNISDPFKIHV
jgi:hypothetical protein